MDCSKIVELFFQAVITLGATYLGVNWAIKGDNNREKENNKNIKARLIHGLLSEISRLKDFLQQKEFADSKEVNVFDTQILSDTVREQLTLINSSELIKELSKLRKQTLELKAIAKFLLEYLPAGYQGATFGQPKFDKITNSWSATRKETLNSIETIESLLELEKNK